MDLKGAVQHSNCLSIPNQCILYSPMKSRAITAEDDGIHLLLLVDCRNTKVGRAISSSLLTPLSTSYIGLLVFYHWPSLNIDFRHFATFNWVLNAIRIYFFLHSRFNSEIIVSIPRCFFKHCEKLFSLGQSLFAKFLKSFYKLANDCRLLG